MSVQAGGGKPTVGAGWSKPIAQGPGLHALACATPRQHPGTQPRPCDRYKGNWLTGSILMSPATARTLQSVHVFQHMQLPIRQHGISAVAT